MKRLLILLTVYGLAAQTPTGTVIFRDGATTLCSIPLNNSSATCQVSTLTPGPHSLTATYSGDTSFAGSTSAFAQTVSGGPAPVFTFSATATEGQPFSFQFTANNGPSYSATELPAGLSINPATGLISGTPAVSGSFSVIVNATNANGIGSVILALTISPGIIVLPPVINSFIANPTSITQGQSSTLSWSVSNATSVSISTLGVMTGNSVTVTPAVTTTYALTASGPGGTATSSVMVTVTPVQPPPGVSITSLVPSSPTLGQTVTVIGSGFTPTGNIVWFTASNGSAFGQAGAGSTGTSLSFQVNASFTHGPYKMYLTNSLGTSNAVTFTVQ